MGLDGATGIFETGAGVAPTVWMSMSLCSRMTAEGDLGMRHPKATWPCTQANQLACAQRAAQGGVTESDRGPPAAAFSLWWEGQANRDLSTGPWP